MKSGQLTMHKDSECQKEEKGLSLR